MTLCGSCLEANKLNDMIQASPDYARSWKLLAARRDFLHWACRQNNLPGECDCPHKTGGSVLGAD
jgi:hypothetical protein